MWQTSGDRDNKVFNGIQCMQYTCNMIYVYVHQCASYDLMYIYMIHVRIVYSKHHPILPFSPPPHFLARTISQTFITTLAFPLDMPCRFVSLHLTSTNGTTISSWWLYIFLFSLIMSLILFHFIWIFSRPSYADIIFFQLPQPHHFHKQQLDIWRVRFGLMSTEQWWGQLGCWNLSRKLET